MSTGEWDQDDWNSLMSEASQPWQWYMMAFTAADLSLLGAALIKGPGPVHVANRCRMLHLNPGGRPSVTLLDQSILTDEILTHQEKLLSQDQWDHLLRHVYEKRKSIFPG